MWVLVLLGLAAVYIGFAVLVGRFCGMNERRCEARGIPSLGERLLAPRAVDGWQDRPEAVAADGREVRCYVPLDRRAA